MGNVRKVVFINPFEKTGKTSILREIALSLVSSSYKVLLIDLDPKMELTNSFLESKDSISIYKDLHHALTRNTATSIATIEKNLHMICGSRNMSLFELELSGETNAALKLKDFMEKNIDENAYDFILIDTPYSADMISSNAMTVSDYILFIVDLKSVGKRNIESILRFSVDIKNAFNPELKILGAIINKINPDMDYSSARKGYRDIFQDNLFKSYLSENNSLRIASRDNKALRDVPGITSKKALDEIKNMRDEFLRKLRK